VKRPIKYRNSIAIAAHTRSGAGAHEDKRAKIEAKIKEKEMRSDDLTPVPDTALGHARRARRTSASMARPDSRKIGAIEQAKAIALSKIGSVLDLAPSDNQLELIMRELCALVERVRTLEAARVAALLEGEST